MISFNAKLWQLAGLFLIIATICTISYQNGKERDKNDFIKVDSSNINSSVRYIESNSSGIHVRLKNNRKFVFQSASPYIGEYKLHRVMSRGDSIIKLPYSDTLTLIHKGEVIKFKLEKPD